MNIQSAPPLQPDVEPLQTAVEPRAALLSSPLPNIRIVHLEMGRHWVGGPNQVLSLCVGLHRRGVDSWLICPPDSLLAEKATSLGLNVRTLPVWGDLDPRLFLRARRILHDLDPDIVHLHSRRGADTWGALAARTRVTPRVILSRRVDDLPGPGFIRRWKYHSGCDHIIAISNGIRRVLLDWGVPGEKVTCVRSAIDLGPYDIQPVDPDGFRLKYGIPLNAPVVSVIAQLIPRKGHRALLDAVPGILKRVPDAYFLFCGEGSDRTALESLVHQRGLKERVLFPGYLREVPTLLAATDVVAHPALREGLGIAILEAMGMGKPVVASSVGGIPEVIIPPETGFLVPPGDSIALGERLIQLLENVELRQRIGQAASERVRSQFSMDGMVSGNIAVYERVLASPAR